MQLPPRFVTSLLLVLFGFTFILSATLPTVEIGKWSPGPDLTRPLANASAVLLSDGSLFISGGNSTDGPVAAAQIFSGGAFGSAGSMSVARANHASVVLKDGRVLITGGTTASGATNQAELFDPADGSWSAAGNLLDARSGHTASLLHDGRVLIAGGSGSAGPISSLEIYDPDTNSFSAAGALASARADHAAVVLSNGHVLIIGGSDGSQALASTEIFNPGDNSVPAGPTLSTPRAKASATTLLDGRIAVIGGNNGSADLASAEIYNGGSFSSVSDHFAQPRSGHLAFLLPHNNSVLIVGGSAAGNDLASAELFAPWSGNFTSTGSLSSPRNGSVGGPLDTDGLLIVAGGNNSASSELYGFATLKTDKDDYAPGQTVQITGSGWQPGETVTLSLVESPNIDTHPSITTTADANGNIADGSFSPDIHDLNVRFYLTATGSVSSAQTTFTDAAGDDTTTTIACTPNPVTQNSATTCTATVNNTAIPVTNGFPQGTVLFQFTGAGTAGTFTSNPCTLTRIGTTNNSSCTVTLTPTTAVSGKVKANYNALDSQWKNSVSANLDLTVNAPTCTAPAVTTNPSGTTAAAGQNVSFVAAASGSPAPTVQWQVSTNGGSTFTNLSGATSTTLTLNSVTATMSGNQYRAVFTNTCTPSTATSTAATLTVSKSTPVITWSNPADITYGTALSGTQLNATATFNGNPVAGTFTYTPAAGTKLSAGNNQTLSVDFAPTDTGTYNSVNNTTVHINVLKAVLTVTADDKSKVYGAALPSFTHAITGFVNGDTSSVVSGTPACTSTGTSSSAVGTYPITCTIGTLAASNYSFGFAPGTLTVTKAALTVKGDDKSRTYGAANPAFTGVLTGVVNSDNITATYTTTATTGSNVGTYPITPTLNDPDSRLGNYTVTSTNGALTIDKASLSVKADDKSRTYGAANPTFTGVLTGIVNGDNITATYTTTATIDSNIGTYPITPSLADPDNRLGNYDVSSTNSVLTIIKAGLSVKADDKSRTYGAANPAFTGVLTGVVNSDNITATYSTLAAAGSNVGTYAITPALADPDHRLGNYDVTSTDGTLLITKAALSVTADDKSRTYGAANPALTGALTGVVNSDNITATYSTLAVQGSNVGTYPITPALSDPDHRLGNYDVTSTDGTLLIIKAALSVKADDKSRTYGAANPAFTGVLTGVVNSDNITATYSSLAVQGSNIGSYAITPALSDPDSRLANYDVSSTDGTLLISKAGLSVKADDKSRSYGAANPAFTGVLTGVVNSDNITATYSSLAVQGSNIGSYAITPALADPDHRLGNYDVTSTDGTLLISKVALSVTADDKSRTYGAANPALTGVLTGVVNSDNITATYSTPATAASNIGNYVITPALADPDHRLGNYNVTSTNGTLAIGKAILSVTADDKSRTYGAANPALTGALTGVVNGDNITASYSTAAVVGSNIGSCPITPALSDPDHRLPNYDVTSTDGTLLISKAALSVTADAKSRTYGAANPAFTGVLSGVVNGDNITATYASAATPSSDVGTYPITPTLLDPNSRLGNYAVTSTNGVLTINTALLTITADNKSKVYNAGNPALTATYLGFVLSQNSSSLTGALACSTTAVLNSLVGSYPINCSGQASTNYAITYVAGTLKVLYSTLACAGSVGHTILQPINPDGSSVFKQGSTTPAKFRVCDANGVSIGTAGVVSSFKIVAVQAGLVTQTVNEDPVSTTPDDAFRWDPTDKQWIFNIKTKNLFANDTYTFAITLNDGSTIPFMYGLK